MQMTKFFTFYTNNILDLLLFQLMRIHQTNWKIWEYTVQTTRYYTQFDERKNQYEFRFREKPIDGIFGFRCKKNSLHSQNLQYGFGILLEKQIFSEIDSYIFISLPIRCFGNYFGLCFCVNYSIFVNTLSALKHSLSLSSRFNQILNCDYLCHTYDM